MRYGEWVRHRTIEILTEKVNHLEEEIGWLTNRMITKGEDRAHEINVKKLRIRGLQRRISILQNYT